MKRRLLLAASLALLVAAVPSRAETAGPDAGPTPDAACAPGAHEESMQGRAPAEDVADGQAALGYRCNAVDLGHYGSSGGYRVERYVDAAGHECAFYDSDTFVGEQAPKGDDVGVYVLDMSDPGHPVRTATLTSAAMVSPHESLRLNQRRGLLAAALSSISTGPGQVDVYDVQTDCRHPRLLSSTPTGVLGHESAFAPDGRTFYVSSLNMASLAAVDLSDPTSPQVVWFVFKYNAHGMSVSDDGTRLYVAESGSDYNGLTVLDVSQVQARKSLPDVTVVSRLTWPQVSIPQTVVPFTRHGHRYLLETDEFGERVTGAARIIDIADERHPYVVSNLRLQVNQPEVYDQLQNDPGNGNAGRGYQAHYCTVPSRVDPNLVACSFIMSGLRVFDIRDVAHPVELAYANNPTTTADPLGNVGAFAMSAPAYDPASHDVWYSDGNSGFWVVHLVGAAGIPFAARYVDPGS